MFIIFYNSWSLIPHLSKSVVSICINDQISIFRGVAFQGCHRKPQAAVANLRVWQSTVAGGGASENRMWQPGAEVAAATIGQWLMVEWLDRHKIRLRPYVLRFT